MQDSLYLSAQINKWILGAIDTVYLTPFFHNKVSFFGSIVCFYTATKPLNHILIYSYLICVTKTGQYEAEKLKLILTHYSYSLNFDHTVGSSIPPSPPVGNSPSHF